MENALFEEARENAGNPKTVFSSFGLDHEGELESVPSRPAIEAMSSEQDVALLDEIVSIPELREIYSYDYVLEHLPETRNKLLADCRAWNMSLPEVLGEVTEYHAEKVTPRTIRSVAEDYTKKTDEELDKTGFNVQAPILQEYVWRQFNRICKNVLIGEVVQGCEQRRKALMERAMPSPEVMDPFMRYQTSVDRQFSKALGELLHVIDRRKLTNKKH